MFSWETSWKLILTALPSQYICSYFGWLWQILNLRRAGLSKKSLKTDQRNQIENWHNICIFAGKAWKLTPKKFENWPEKPRADKIISSTSSQQFSVCFKICSILTALHCIALHCVKSQITATSVQLCNAFFNFGHIVQLTVLKKRKRLSTIQTSVWTALFTVSSYSKISNISTSKHFIDGTVGLMYMSTYSLATWSIWQKGDYSPYALVTQSIAGSSFIKLVKEAKWNYWNFSLSFDMVLLAMFISAPLCMTACNLDIWRQLLPLCLKRRALVMSLVDVINLLIAK